MSGQLPRNVIHFVQALRAAGLPLGPSATLDALSVVEAVGLSRRDDLHAGLQAALITRQDQRELFNQAFSIFWQNPKYLERLMRLMLPELTQDPGARKGDDRKIQRRLFDALLADRPPTKAETAPEQEELELDARLTFADQDVLRRKDFEQMSAAELQEARRILRQFRLPIPDALSRRQQRALRGKVDPHATLRANWRGGQSQAALTLVYRAPQRRPRPLVVLADISGSMASYSRLLLFFLHAIANDRDRVHSFVFGTRLTNITRALKQKDVDAAVDQVARSVVDWSGGTRIGACLDRFNRDWARRTLGQGATVLLITDGLDRGDDGLLEPAIDRLSRLARQIIWLNPLLRYEGYQATARGARILLPRVDALRSAHNINSLTDLAKALSQS